MEAGLLEETSDAAVVEVSRIVDAAADIGLCVHHHGMRRQRGHLRVRVRAEVEVPGIEDDLQPGGTGLAQDAQHPGGGAREAPVVLQEERHSFATRVVAGDLERLGGPGIAVLVGISRERRLAPSGRHELAKVGARGPAAAEGPQQKLHSRLQAV